MFHVGEQCRHMSNHLPSMKSFQHLFRHMSSRVGVKPFLLSTGDAKKDAEKITRLVCVCVCVCMCVRVAVRVCVCVLV